MTIAWVAGPRTGRSSTMNIRRSRIAAPAAAVPISLQMAEVVDEEHPASDGGGGLILRGGGRMVAGDMSAPVQPKSVAARFDAQDPSVVTTPTERKPKAGIAL